MPSTAHIRYALSSNNELFISCYHEPLACVGSYSELARQHNLPKGGTYVTAKVDNNEDEEEIKKIIINKLKEIKNPIEAKTIISKITLTADVNLCTKSRDVLAYFLIDDSLTDFYGNKQIVRQLESGTGKVVEEAIKYYKANSFRLPIVLKTKSITPPKDKQYYSSSTGDAASTKRKDLEETATPPENSLISKGLKKDKEVIKKGTAPEVEEAGRGKRKKIEHSAIPEKDNVIVSPLINSATIEHSQLLDEIVRPIPSFKDNKLQSAREAEQQDEKVIRPDLAV
ncbi:Uncharacterised protein [Legionella beliardensis]|uniref:Uncharacterized protein n=1 Tax=Legionella beliardensis TaxID=91822 RepID=A0A378HYM0_9GAMM|nr:hypothetical protein [Legionella beliardensis]STX27631.1 Uncharacterised protein [Legionella beliardensis]